MTMYTDGSDLVDSVVTLQEWADVPAVVLKRRLMDGNRLRVEVNGVAQVDAAALIHAVLALCPTALDQTAA